MTKRIWIDGGCDPNPGAGGYGIFVLDDGKQTEWYGHVANTTNNQMELLALIKALEMFAEDGTEIYTDSAYLLNGATSWIFKWRSNNWTTADKNPVKNQALWEKIYTLMQAKSVKLFKVKGHGDNEYNNIAHELATKGRLESDLKDEF